MKNCSRPTCRAEMPDDRKNKYCKECWREITKNSRLKNPGPSKEATKKWAKENKEAVAAYRKEYASRPEVAEKRRATYRAWYHSEAGQAWTKKYREEHAERAKECLTEWRRAHPDQAKASRRASYHRVGKITAKKWREDNKEKLRQKESERWVREKSVILARLREWYKTPAGIAFVKRHQHSANVKFTARYRTDPEFRATMLARTAKRKAENPEKFAEYQRRYESGESARGNAPEPRRSSTPGAHTVEEWLELYSQAGAQCHYCGRSLTLAEASPDHAIPISKDGDDSIENLRVSCWPCNKLKGAKTETEFIAYLVDSRRFG